MSRRTLRSRIFGRWTRTRYGRGVGTRVGVNLFRRKTSTRRRRRVYR